MTRWLAVLLVISTGQVGASKLGSSQAIVDALCSESWYRSIEEKVPTGDGRGHGPDLGSEEWKSVVEFKLGIRNQPTVPPRDSEAWCRFIQQLVNAGSTSSTDVRYTEEATVVQGPSFPCDNVEGGSVEAMVCEDRELSALDRKLASVYRAASRMATDEHPPQLRGRQRGWIKGRNECWKAADTRECVHDTYRRRIAELEARYRLVPGSGPFRFVCDGNPSNEVVVSFFETAPPTLIAERGDSVSMMFRQQSSSGATYQGRNETLWEGEGEVSITWGYGAPKMRCRKPQSN